MSVGSAATARVAASNLTLPLLLVSAVLLGAAHYRVWVRRQGHPAARAILLVNTVAVIVLWTWRLGA